MSNGTPTSNMSLIKWGGTDKFDYNQLANNFELIDAHDHSPGSGILIPNEGLVSTAGSEAIDTNVIRDGAITADKIATGTIDSTVLGPSSIQKSNLNYSSINDIILAADLPDAEDVDPGYVAMVTDNKNNPAYIWQFRYCEGESGANPKWQFIGGNSVRNDIFPGSWGVRSTDLDTYKDIDSTVGGSGGTASIALPNFGATVVYKVEIWSTVFKGSSDQANNPISIFNSFKSNEAAATNADSAAALIFDDSSENVSSQTPATIYRSVVFSASSAVNLLTAQFRQSSADGDQFFITRHGIAATPIYISLT